MYFAAIWIIIYLEFYVSSTWLLEQFSNFQILISRGLRIIRKKAVKRIQFWTKIGSFTCFLVSYRNTGKSWVTVLKYRVWWNLFQSRIEFFSFSFNVFMLEHSHSILLISFTMKSKKISFCQFKQVTVVSSFSTCTQIKWWARIS